MSTLILDDQRNVAVGEVDIAVTMPEEVRLVPSQRRLWERQEQLLRQGRSENQRRRKALEMGYDPIAAPPYNWSAGLAVHECGWRDRASRDGFGFVGFIASLVLGCLSAWGATVLWGSLSPWAVLGLIGFCVVSGLLIIGLFRRIPTGKHFRHMTVLVYNRPMPAVALAAYIRAREAGIFDEITIWSPERVVFTSIPSSAKSDPLMMGNIGNDFFLILAWDLDKDLQILRRDRKVGDLPVEHGSVYPT